jgi:plasmid stabilization system protein ParE
MTWEVLLRPRAEADLKEARDWYEERQPGLGDDLEGNAVVVFRVLHGRQEHASKLRRL